MDKTSIKLVSISIAIRRLILQMSGVVVMCKSRG